MDKSYKNVIKRNIRLILSALFATACIGTVIFYIFGPSAAYLHSDCTDSLLWAKASVDSGKLFSPDFSYAAMLPIGGSLIMIPLIKLFGYTMLAQQLGMAIFTVIFFAAIFFLCRSADFSLSLSFGCVGVMALTLCSSAKLREIFYEHTIYYSIGILLLSLMLGLSIRFLNICDNKKGIVRFLVTEIFIVLIFVLGALDGTQIISVSMLPVIAAVCAEVLFSSENKIISKANVPKYIFIAVAGISMLFGTMLFNYLSKDIALPGYATAYSTYSNPDEWYSNFIKIFEQWFDLFGVDANRGMKLFEYDSVINIIRIAGALIIGIAPIAALFCFNKLSRASRMIVTAHFAMTAVILFGYVFGVLSNAGWRLSPIICTSILVCAVLLKLSVKNITAKRVAILMTCVIVLMCGISWSNVFEIRTLGVEDNPKYDMMTTLRQNGLSYGYSTFWNSQTITLLSGGEIESINISADEDGVSIYDYQTDRTRTDNPQGEERIFVLLSKNEIEKLQAVDGLSEKLFDCTEIINREDYTVFVYDHPVTNFLIY